MSDSDAFILINGVKYEVDLKFSEGRGVKFTPYGFLYWRTCEPHQSFVAYINIYCITYERHDIKVHTFSKHDFIYTCSSNEVARAYVLEMTQRWLNYIYTEPSHTQTQLDATRQIQERLAVIEDILRYAPPPLPPSQQFTEAQERFESNIKEL